jgi:hypothetical protein
MEVFKCKQHFTRVELRLPERKLLALNVQHEVSSTDILHDEVYASFRLETRVQPKEEGMPILRRREKHALLRTCTVSIL